MSKRTKGKKTPTNRTQSKRSKRFWRSAKVFVIVAMVAVGVYFLDRSGPLEQVPGKVVDTRRYPHGSGSGLHYHIEAVIEFGDTRHTVAEADDLSRGQDVLVDVRTGRFTGIQRYAAYSRAP